MKSFRDEVIQEKKPFRKGESGRKPMRKNSFKEEVMK